jgi:hypothetical protein
LRERRLVVACGIFDEELGALMPELEKLYDLTVIRLPPGYHCDVEALEAKLGQALEGLAEGDRAKARLLFGRKCLPEMDGFCARRKVACLPTANCLSAMAGDERVKGLEDGKTMVITPAWIRKLFLSPEGIPASMKWDAADFRMNFGRYDRMVVLGTGTPPSDGEVLECFDLFGNPVFEFEPCGLERFNALVRGLLA